MIRWGRQIEVAWNREGDIAATFVNFSPDVTNYCRAAVNLCKNMLFSLGRIRRGGGLQGVGVEKNAMGEAH